MLARKYDEYAWELEEQQENTVRQTAYVKRPKQRNLKLMRRRIAVVAGILLATYFACVVRSECLISKSNELVALKQPYRIQYRQRALRPKHGSKLPLPHNRTRTAAFYTKFSANQQHPALYYAKRFLRLQS